MNKKKEKDLEQVPEGTSIINRKDYAEFLDLAIHEIDSPLRKLNFVVEKMAVKYENGETADGRKYFERAVNGIQQVRNLVDALYNLSQLDIAEPEHTACNTQQFVEQLSREIQSANKDKKIVINAGELPEAWADPAQLRSLFGELIKNAVRFSGEEVLVEITAAPVSDEDKLRHELQSDRSYHKFIFRDNGIGISSNDYQRIFQPLVRLNGRSEYPGNGIGLARCKKIAALHHGTIYAESNEPHGTSFILILPTKL